MKKIFILAIILGLVWLLLEMLGFADKKKLEFDKATVNRQRSVEEALQ